MDSRSQIIDAAIRRVRTEGLAKEHRSDRSECWHRMREFAAAEITHNGTIKLDSEGIVLVDAVTEIAYYLLITTWKGGPLEDEANWNLAMMYSLVWQTTSPIRRADLISRGM